MKANEYGGNSSLGKRKVERPFSSKNANHIVFKFNFDLQQEHIRYLRNLIKVSAWILGIRMYGLAFENNHIHIVGLSKEKESLTRFYQTIGGSFSQHLGGIKVFAKMTYTKVITWGQEYKNLLKYLCLNILEFTRGLPRVPRHKKKENWIQKIIDTAYEEKLYEKYLVKLK